jgi:hypothetical protein
MAENTKIAWATHSWSPWLGCSHVHTGCANCYAEAMAGRMGVTWGPNGTRRRTAASTWKQVERWNRKAACNCYGKDAADGLTHLPECPQHDRPRVFPSLCDPFEKISSDCVFGPDNRPIYEPVCSAPNFFDPADWRRCGLSEIRRDFFALIDRCQNLDFLLLTKRPENIRRMWPFLLGGFTDGSKSRGFNRQNVLLLYSASDQATLDAGLPHLLSCRDLVSVLGLSLEPLIGPVQLHGVVWRCCDNAAHSWDLACRKCGRKMVDWVIVGGESGPHARPCNVDWIRSIRDQCREAGVPCFVKQLGTACQSDLECELSQTYAYSGRPHDPKGGDPSEWPEDLRVQEFPR